MSYYIYSHDPLPNPEMMGKSRYTPDSDYIRTAGVTLPVLPGKTWVELDEDDPRFTTFHRQDWTVKKANLHYINVRLKQFMPIVNGKESRFALRGVVMLDHEPSAEEKARLEKACAQNNLEFRRKAIEFYEQQAELAKANKGTYPPNPYIDECYDILKIKKPYSLEALKEMRSPGEEAASRIAAAIAEGQKESAKAVAEAIGEFLTRPKPEMPAARR